MLQHAWLQPLGWDAFFESAFEPHARRGLAPARVGAQHKASFSVYGTAGESPAQVSGRLLHEARSAADLPAVGDWVAVARSGDGTSATIHAVLPRRSKFSRQVAGFRVDEQVLAANVDAAFVLTSCDRDANPARLERYLAMAREGASEPVIVLTKVDLCEDLAAMFHRIRRVAAGVPVHAISSLTGSGLAEIAGYFQPGVTVALLGSSGVGKSTLVNALSGEPVQVVAEIRHDGRGRHTTARRDLVLLPGGGLVMDTPGLREIQLWGDGTGVAEAFEDIADLARGCRFRDCAHDREPGCEVRSAVASGALSAERLRSYNKLRREIEFLERKRRRGARRAGG